MHLRSELLIKPGVAGRLFSFVCGIARDGVLRRLGQLRQAVLDLLYFVPLGSGGVDGVRVGLAVGGGLDGVGVELVVLIIPRVRHTLVRLAEDFEIADVDLLPILLQMARWWRLENLRLLKLIYLLFLFEFIRPVEFVADRVF